MSADFWNAWTLLAGFVAFGFGFVALMASLEIGYSENRKAIIRLSVGCAAAAIAVAATIPFLIELAHRAKP